MKLNKFLAYAGVASRRKTADLIKKGVVFVNKMVILDPSYEVKQCDIVYVHGKPVIPQEPLYILLNKPVGYITTTADEKGRPTVIDLLDKRFKERLFPVGRLDRNTTGLLLFTNDGLMAQRLAHPRYNVAKAYQVTLHKPLHLSDRAHIIRGVRLDDGVVVVDRISHALGSNKNIVRITLHSGKYRVVRRLFEKLGYQVKKLDRIQYAFLTKRGLPLGVWRKLTQKEIASLHKLLKKGENNGSVSEN